MQKNSTFQENTSAYRYHSESAEIEGTLDSRPKVCDPSIAIRDQYYHSTPIIPPAQSKLKRGFDLIVASLILVGCAPLMLLLVLAVCADGGPALFGHRRVGAGGRDFTCWKFRSMVVDAEAALAHTLAHDPGARREWERDFKLRNDPRVTRLGKFLRKTSLDELPQLLNVLSGSMSLVGPRPVLAWEADMFDPVHLRRFEVKPGITGLWQIRGRSKLGMREALDLDVEYVLRRSIARDLFILVMTVPALFRGGAS